MRKKSRGAQASLLFLLAGNKAGTRLHREFTTRESRTELLLWQGEHLRLGKRFLNVKHFLLTRSLWRAFLSAALVFTFARCAANTAPTNSAPLPTVATVSNSPAPSVNATETPMPAPSPSSSPSSTPLVSALELAANEMRAAQTAATVAEARSRAEAAVNILVGKYGRWYGDQNGDGKISDPSDKRGVLPGEKSPVSGADSDAPPQFPIGLAFLAIGSNPNSLALVPLLGDVDVWRTKPRAGYDTIANALAQANATPNLDTLQGSVPRTVAFARLILTNAQTVDAAHAFAARAVQELDAASRTAETISR